MIVTTIALLAKTLILYIAICAFILIFIVMIVLSMIRQVLFVVNVLVVKN